MAQNNSVRTIFSLITTLLMLHHHLIYLNSLEISHLINSSSLSSQENVPEYDDFEQIESISRNGKGKGSFIF